MNTLEQTKQAVQNLLPGEYRQFREWFERLDAEAWDREFEAHAESGRLDSLADQALADLDASRCGDL